MPFTKKVITSDEYYGDTLVCPECGGMLLHHMRVECFERGEDDKTGTYVTNRAGDVTVSHGKLKENPSHRRNGIIIHFFCEDCEEEPRLTIAQHKGCTLFKWIQTKT